MFASICLIFLRHWFHREVFEILSESQAWPDRTARTTSKTRIMYKSRSVIAKRENFMYKALPTNCPANLTIMLLVQGTSGVRRIVLCVAQVPVRTQATSNERTEVTIFIITSMEYSAFELENLLTALFYRSSLHDPMERPGCSCITPVDAFDCIYITKYVKTLVKKQILHIAGNK